MTKFRKEKSKKESINEQKRIIEHNLKALRKIETSTEFMLLYGILDAINKRTDLLEEKDEVKEEKFGILLETKRSAKGFNIEFPVEFFADLKMNTGGYFLATIEEDKIVLRKRILFGEKESVLNERGKKKLTKSLNEIKRGEITNE